MQIEIKTRGIETTNELRSRVERRIRFALGRFGAEVSSVLVRLDDINGPRGGVDKRCHVVIAGARIGGVTIDALDADMIVAVELALARAARSVRRSLERLRWKATRVERATRSAS
jgi:putative sigma-54 modulation protein